MIPINDERTDSSKSRIRRRQRSVVLQGLRERRHDRDIVRRAKKLAVKREIAEKGRGLRAEDLTESIRQEYRENEDLPNTDEPGRLGTPCRAEGRADHLYPHPRESRRDRRPRRSLHPTRRHRPVPLGRCPSRRSSGSRLSTASRGPRPLTRSWRSSIIVNAYAQEGRTRINWTSKARRPTWTRAACPT